MFSNGDRFRSLTIVADRHIKSHSSASVSIERFSL